MKYTETQIAETILENGLEQGGKTLINAAKSAYNVLEKHNKNYQKDTRITELEAEVERLRNSLQRIFALGMRPMEMSDSIAATRMWSEAQQTLNGEQK